MTERPSQVLMENWFSQRNIHDVLHRSIAYQLDKAFLLWAIGAYMRINTFLEGNYYPSKNKRLQVLREYTASNGLEGILTATIAGSIRAKRNQPIQSVIGYLQKFMPHDDHFDRARTAGEIIAICAGAFRLFSIKRPENDEAPIVVINHWTSLTKLFASEFEWIQDTFYNPPLLTKPREVQNNQSCGYYTIKEPVVLGQNTQHNDSLDYVSLNILNKIPWVIDPYVRALPEMPPSKLTDAQEIQNFLDHRKQANKIYNILGADPFWLAWQFDSRGRMYSHGHHVNFQSYEYKKALLNFNDYHILT